MPATVERAIKCLQLIERSESGSSVSELASRLSTSLASTSRLVQTLRSAGLVSRDEHTGKLHLGLRLWELGSAAASRLTVRRMVLPLVAPAIPELGRPINFVIPEEDGVLFVDHLESIRGVVVAMPFGHRAEYHLAAVGKAMLAFAPRTFVARIVERGLTRETEHTIANAADLECELAAVRAAGGVAVTREERRLGAYGIGAAILDASGRAVGALGMQVSDEEAHPQSMLARQLHELAKSVSLQLGYIEDFRNSLT